MPEDAFSYGKAHLVFASYDMNRPAGQRQTNNIHIYLSMTELLELCRKAESGELRYLLQAHKKNGSKDPIYQCLGGTSAEKLAKIGRSRPDGMSLSRTAQLLAGSKSDFLLVADSGPGQTNEKGLIVPRFGNKPENHVAISMTFESLCELLQVTKIHYQAWLSAVYARRIDQQNDIHQQPQSESQVSNLEADKPMKDMF